MKILLIKDVHKLGRAGDVKKVANGYGRNYLIPQGFAVLATPGAIKQADRIRQKADEQRAILNQEMAGISKILEGKMVSFPVRASETGRLYGSVTTRMVSDALNASYGVEINHHQIESQPLRMLGTYTIPVRLTLDLMPEVTVIVHREGESPIAFEEEAEAVAAVVEEEATDVKTLEAEPESEIEEFAADEPQTDEAEEA